YAISFLLVLPVGGGAFEFSRRLARFQVVPGVEAGEVLADDLLGRIALEPLGPSIPGGDHALWVEHEDGVVPNPLDQQAETLFAQAKFLLGLFPIRKVSRDLQEAPNLAGIVPQGGDDDVGPKPCPILADPPGLVLESARDRRHAQFVSRPAG